MRQAQKTFRTEAEFFKGCFAGRYVKCKIPPCMVPVLEKILPAIVTGLILPLLLFRFQVSPWSAPIRYWSVAAVCFAISFLVYKFRHKGNERLSFKTHVINFVISFVVVCLVAVGYLLMLTLLYALI